MKKKLTIAVLVCAMMLAIFAPLTVQADKPGWEKSGGYWYYYYSTDSYYSNGMQWVNESNNFFYFDKSGKMLTGWIKDVQTY